jgi:hypothetical protein
MFRGVMVPPVRTLEMDFSDPAFERGKSISMASRVILCGCWRLVLIAVAGRFAAPPAAATDRAVGRPALGGR